MPEPRNPMPADSCRPAALVPAWPHWYSAALVPTALPAAALVPWYRLHSCWPPGRRPRWVGCTRAGWRTGAG
eukprot:14312109-Alexandrium_andersonii.AAC.1